MTQHLETSGCPGGRRAERSGRQAGAHGWAPWGSPEAGGGCSPSAAQPQPWGSLLCLLWGALASDAALHQGETPVSPPREGRSRSVHTLHPYRIDAIGMAAEKGALPGRGGVQPRFGGCWAGSILPALLWVCFKEVLTRCAFGSFQQGVNARGF